MTRSRCSANLILLAIFCPLLAAFGQTAQPAPANAPLPFFSAPEASVAEQTNFPPQLREELNAIKTAALADDYAYHLIAHLTENIGPRPSGSLQAKAAVEYVAGELGRLGLEVHLEEVKVPHWVRGAETAELVEYAGQAAGTSQKIVLTALGGSTATPADGLTTEVVVVNNFDELKALGREKVAGKIVLFNEIFDKQKAAAGMAFISYGEAVRYRGTGPKAAAELGAVAALVRSVGSADFRLPHTGFSFAAGIPAGAVTAEDAELMAHLALQGKVRMHLTLTPQRLPEVTSYNVIADLKGSEHPEQLVVVSGHLDSWDLGTGAIDDGAGVVVAMEAAEILQKLHLRPKRTLRVIAWMDEENGGSGSQAYTKDYSAYSFTLSLPSKATPAQRTRWVSTSRCRRMRPSCCVPRWKCCKVSERMVCDPAAIRREPILPTCRKRACRRWACCRTGALTSTITTPRPTRWIKLFPPSCVRTPRRWR